MYTTSMTTNRTWYDYSTEERQEHAYHTITQHTNYTFEDIYKHQDLIFDDDFTRYIWKHQHNPAIIRAITNIAITCSITTKPFTFYLHNITEACHKHNLPADHPILGVITAEAPHDFDPIYKIWQTIIFHFEEYGWTEGALLTLTHHNLNITGQPAVRTQEQLLAGILYYWSENKRIPLETITHVFYREYRTYPTGLAESGDTSRRTKYVEKIKEEHAKNMV